LTPHESVEATYRVRSLEHPTDKVAELWLRPRSEAIEYHPGQYVLLEDSDRRIPQRSYSIANAPCADGRLSLLVTRTGGRTSEWVHTSLRADHEVVVTGPYGDFGVDVRASAPRLYLAAGSGLAPLRALLQDALATAACPPQLLVFSARTEAEVIDRRQFLDAQAAHPSFTFAEVLTRAGGARCPRIPALLGELCPNLVGRDVFIAGAPGFVRDCAAAGRALGATNVHTELFFVD
jgi:CDP-4-dehydro-6-deoxyglucose reductase